MAAPWLADALRAGGVPVAEEPGWLTRGTGGTFTPLGVLLHHTAGPRAGNLPSLGIVRDGRSGLPGPLSQLMLSRAGVFHVVASGRANHAGVGYAPWVPAQDGNRYLIGIEAESCGVVDDWTPEQRVNYPKGVAALCRYMRVGESRVIGHKEWAPTRKIDPAFWNLKDFRAQVRAYLIGTPAPTPPKELFMALSENEEREILEAARSVLFGKAGVRGAGQLALAVSHLDQKMSALQATVDTLAGLVAQGANDLTADQVRAAVAEAIAQSVDFEVTVNPTVPSIDFDVTMSPKVA